MQASKASDIPVTTSSLTICTSNRGCMLEPTCFGSLARQHACPKYAVNGPWCLGCCRCCGSLGLWLTWTLMSWKTWLSVLRLPGTRWVESTTVHCCIWHVVASCLSDHKLRGVCAWHVVASSLCDHKLSDVYLYHMHACYALKCIVKVVTIRVS